VGTGGSHAGGLKRLERETDHSPPFSDKVRNE